jgi:hypothetical protein
MFYGFDLYSIDFREDGIMTLASVAKLNSHIGDPVFDDLMTEIDAAQLEGDQFELNVDRLDHTIRMDIIVALEDLGYIVDYDSGEESLVVSYE